MTVECPVQPVPAVYPLQRTSPVVLINLTRGTVSLPTVSGTQIGKLKQIKQYHILPFDVSARVMSSAAMEIESISLDNCSNLQDKVCVWYDARVSVGVGGGCSSFRLHIHLSLP